MRRAVPAVLREEPQFRLLFTGQILSVLGDQMTVVALPFAVLSIGGGPGAIGLVAAATTIPFLALSLLGGVWADRRPRHRVMLASDAVRAVAQALAAALLLTGAAHVWQLAALGVVFGTADAFFMPALSGLLPTLLPAERVQEANALRSLVLSFSRILGPGVAGGLIALSGPGEAIALDAATFAVSAAALSRLRPASVARTVGATAARVADDLRAGFAEVRSRDWVQGFLAVICVYCVVVLPAISVLGPVLAERELDGASSWALIVAGFGAGCVLGDLLILRFKPERPLLVAAVGFVVGSAQAAIIGSGLGTGGIAALEAVAGIGVTAAWGLWETSIQVQIPERAVSRVSSYDYLLTAGLQPVGLILAGPLAALIGLHATLRLESAVGIPVALALLAVPSVRRIRRPGAGRGTA